MTPDPPSLFTLKHMQWPYQSKIVGAGPASNYIGMKETQMNELILYKGKYTKTQLSQCLFLQQGTKL